VRVFNDNIYLSLSLSERYGFFFDFVRLVVVLFSLSLREKLVQNYALLIFVLTFALLLLLLSVCVCA